jgi:hypothetical protein
MKEIKGMGTKSQNIRCVICPGDGVEAVTES